MFFFFISRFFFLIIIIIFSLSDTVRDRVHVFCFPETKCVASGRHPQTDRERNDARRLSWGACAQAFANLYRKNPHQHPPQSREPQSLESPAKKSGAYAAGLATTPVFGERDEKRKAARKGERRSGGGFVVPEAWDGLFFGRFFRFYFSTLSFLMDGGWRADALFPALAALTCWA